MKKRIAVEIACETKDTLPLYALTEFQGSLKKIEPDDLDRLKNEILRTGFAFPVYVWKDAKAKKNYIVGGHQRVKALAALRDSGVKVPDVPVVYVAAKDRRQAKRRVLQDVAQFAKVTGNGLTDFLADADIELDDIVEDLRIPELNLDMLLKANKPPSRKKVEFLAQEKTDEEEAPKLEGQHECPRCGHIF